MFGTDVAGGAQTETRKCDFRHFQVCYMLGFFYIEKKTCFR